MIRPFNLQVEPTNICGLHCPMCPHDIMTRRQGYMTLKLFKKIIDDCKPLDNLTLCHFGEPLLHPRIVRMINHAKRNGVKHILTSTNGVHLRGRLSSSLAKSDLDMLILSVDGLREKYENVRRGTKWDKVYLNIIRFMRKEPKCKVQVQIIDFDLVDVKEAQDFWINQGLEVNVKQYSTWAHQFKGFRSKHHLEPRLPCPILDKSMTMLWDGTVVPCCRDFDGKVPLGNVSEENVLKIFNNASYREIRGDHKRGYYDNLLCGKCVGWAEAWGIETQFK